MKSFLQSLKTSLLAILFLTLLLGIVYPLLMFGIGQLLFHKEANGSLIVSKDGRVFGSAWIGQSFTSPKYFHPRPSSAGEQGYDAANSSPSNLGPTSQKLIDALSSRSSAYRQTNGLSESALLPAEAVTGSGSGLDPHISVANAYLQAARIYQARGLPEEMLANLIAEYTEGRSLWLFGEERINVLKINLALDGITP